MVRDYGDRPPSRRGHKKSFGSLTNGTLAVGGGAAARLLVPLETRGNANGSGSGTLTTSTASGTSKVHNNMNEYDSLQFDKDSSVPSQPKRRETSIQIPTLKSSSSSRRQDRESVLVRPRDRAAGENPLAQASRLQGTTSTTSNIHSISNSHGSRFLQAGLGSTMDQVQKATEPYAARKNRAKQSRASLSTSRDVLGSALLQTKRASPKPGPHNTVDLCLPDDDDEDEHEDHTSPNPSGATGRPSPVNPRQRSESHDSHSSPHYDSKEMPGYMQTLQHARSDVREQPKHRQGPTAVSPKQSTLGPPDSSSQSTISLSLQTLESVDPMSPDTQYHGQTFSHPAEGRRLRSNSPKSLPDQAPLDHSSNTPSPPPTTTLWSWRRASAPAPSPAPPANSLDQRNTTERKSPPPLHQHEQEQPDKEHPPTKRPKVDFSNVPDSDAKVIPIEQTPLHSPKAKPSISTGRSIQHMDGLTSSSSDEDLEPPHKKLTLGKGMWNRVKNIFSPGAKPKQKTNEKKKKSKTTFTTVSEGTPTEQLPEDLRSVIKGNKSHSNHDDSSLASPSSPPLLPKRPPPQQKDDSTKLRQMAEALEIDDDWSKPTQASVPAHSATFAQKKPWVESSKSYRNDSDPEYEPSRSTFPVSKFRLSKANNKVINSTTTTNHAVSRRTNTYGSIKPKATKISPGCTFQKKQDTSPFPWREEESPSHFHPSQSTPSTCASTVQTRSSARLKRKRHQEVVEIDDSDSEIEEVTISQEPMLEMELIRIAIGKKVATAECMAQFDPNTCELHLAWKNTKRARTRSDDRGGRDSRTLSLRDGALQQFVVYAATESFSSTGNETHDFDHLNSFVAMRITPTADNLLNRYSKSYIPEHEDPKYRYVILEFRDATMFSAFVTKSEDKLPTNVELLHIPRECCGDYASSLLANNYEEQKWRQRNKFVAGRALDYKLLVFPFGGDPHEIESAAEGLTEAARSTPPVDLPLTASQQQTTNNMETDSDNNEDDDTKPRHRAHFVTITVEDYDRLDPGEWLNDSLVDFWMQWISRDDTTLDSKFHFFTSHFFSRLSEEGPEAVASWTRRKKINIFEKKFVFIPINKSMHWSLCLVVNPGAIVEGGDRERTQDDPLSCMIFMDSLRMHNKKNIAETIRNWLNSEWKRMFQDILLDKSARTGEGPFNNDNFKIFSPRVPLQNNTCDCGVFVCRYAHAVYELRHRNFTYGDAGMYCKDDEGRNGASSKVFKELISDSAEFDFNMDDIARFREEFKVLIEKLSTIYLKRKNADKLLEQQQKRQLRNNESTSTDGVGTKIRNQETEPPEEFSNQESKGAADTTAAQISEFNTKTPRIHAEENSKEGRGHNQPFKIRAGESFRRRDPPARNRSTRHEMAIYDTSDDEYPNDSQFGESLTVVNI